MNLISITSRNTGNIIYQGSFHDRKSCAEQAVADGVMLGHADLSRCNLVNANLDEGHFSGASFAGSSLIGANMSEAVFNGTDFSNASLQGCCMAFSRFENCDFTGALFGGTDISGATLINCRFSTLSALAINYIDADKIRDCVFITPDGASYGFGRPPVYIHGLKQPVILLDHHLKIGGSIKSYGEWTKEKRQSGAHF